MNTLGIYYPERSFWHLLDPRSKIVVSLAVMTALFSSQGFGLGLVFLGIIFFYRLSRLPWNLELEVVKKFKWLLLIPFLVNLLIPLNFHGLISSIIEHLPLALTVTLRLTGVLLMASWFSYVTKPLALIEGLTKLSRPFKWLKNGGLDLPLMMGLVVRFVPELFAETENIIIAQRIRGIKPGFTVKNSAKWIKSTIIPIFLASIRKASALAIAIEARGYRPGAPRSSMEPLELRVRDFWVIGLSIIFMAGFILYQNIF